MAGWKLLDRAGLFLLALLIGIILLEMVVAGVRHRSDADWRRLWRQGTAREKVLALHVLTNRSVEPAVDGKFVRQLLASPDPLLREFAFTTSITRFHESELQNDHLLLGAEPDERVRADFFFRFRAGTKAGRPPTTRADGRPGFSRLDPEEIREFLNALNQPVHSGIRKKP